MATQSIASGGTLTISNTLPTGTNVEFLNDSGANGVLIFTRTGIGVETLTVAGTIETNAYFGGTVQNMQPGTYGLPGDQVSIQVISSLFAALDISPDAASDNALFAGTATFAAESGVNIMLEAGTVLPGPGAPFGLTPNEANIIDQMAVGLFGTAANTATLELDFTLRTNPNSNHPFVDGVFIADTPVNPCFAAGTRILTPSGEIPVESLKIDDKLITAEGDEQPITWIGKREIDLSSLRRPELVRPVIVEPGALEDGVPATRLILSPDHALHLDGMLVPVKDLINWTSIRQDQSARHITYYHLELPAHSIIFAESTPVESFLDTGHRGVFDNAAEQVIAHPAAMQSRREAESCAPLCTTGPRLDKIRRRLAARQVGIRLPR